MGGRVGVAKQSNAQKQTLQPLFENARVPVHGLQEKKEHRLIKRTGEDAKGKRKEQISWTHFVIVRIIAMADVEYKCVVTVSLE